MKRLSSWRVTALLVLVLMACVQGFAWRRGRLGAAGPLLDVRGWYTPRQAADLLDGLGESGRILYAVSELSLDLVFPLAYGLLFAILLVRVYPSSIARQVIAVPLSAAVVDVVENVTIAYLAWSYTGSSTPLVWFAAGLTALKSGLLAVTLILVLFGGVRKSRG